VVLIEGRSHRCKVLNSIGAFRTHVNASTPVGSTNGTVPPLSHASHEVNILCQPHACELSCTWRIAHLASHDDCQCQLGSWRSTSCKPNFRACIPPTVSKPQPTLQAAPRHCWQQLSQAWLATVLMLYQPEVWGSALANPGGHCQNKVSQTTGMHRSAPQADVCAQCCTNPWRPEGRPTAVRKWQRSDHRCYKQCTAGHGWPSL
jgi:hypothetical protein